MTADGQHTRIAPLAVDVVARIAEIDQKKLRAYRLERLRAELRRRDYCRLPALRSHQHPLRHRQPQHEAVVHALTRAAGPSCRPRGRWCCSSSPARCTTTRGSRPSPRSRPRTPWFYFLAGPRCEEKAGIWAGEIARNGGASMAAGTAASRSTAASPWAPSSSRSAACSSSTPRKRSSRRVSSSRRRRSRRCASRWTSATPRLPPCARRSVRASPRTSSGRSCTRSTSPTTASGSNRGCSPRASAPIPGSRNAATASSRRATSSPSTPTWWGRWAISRTSRAAGSARASRPATSSGGSMGSRRSRCCTTWPAQAGRGLPRIRGDNAGRCRRNSFRNRYMMMVHGAGLVDEYPSVAYARDFEDWGYDGVFQENMVVCVESYHRRGRRQGRHQAGAAGADHGPRRRAALKDTVRGRDRCLTTGWNGLCSRSSAE